MAIESTQNTPPSDESLGVTLTLDANATLGLASMQNSVPVVRQIQIRNGTPNTLTELEVHIACAPAFAQGARIRYAAIAPGETRTITPVDLKPDYEYLFQLDESVNGSISVCAIVDNTRLAETTVATEILSYDQWAGMRSLPELIAAFSMPNSPVVDQLNSKASRLLRSSDATLLMDGYQSKNRGNVWKQISAVFSTLAAEDIQYAEPPASFGNSGQKIRTPDRILAAKVATCLDLSMLIASCLEQIGLRPLVLFSEGHAWVGCWLIPTNFGTALVDDVQAVRKRVQSGELIVFETTGLAQQQKPSLKFASGQGNDKLEDSVSPGLARHAHDELIRSRVRTLRTHGVERQRQWGLLADAYKESVLRLNAAEIETDWDQAVIDWWPKKLLSKRNVRSRFIPHRIDRKRPNDDEMAETLAILVRVNEEDRVLDEMRADAETLLQESYVGVNTNWSDIERQEAWAKDFADAVVEMACGDLSAIEPLRARLIPYVSEKRSMLALGSVLCNGLEEFRRAYRKALGDVNHVEELAKCTNAFLGQTSAGGFVSRLLAVMHGWGHATRQLRTWCFWRGIRAKAIAQGMQNVVLALENGEIPLHDFAMYFEYSYQEWWLKKTLDRDPILAQFQSADHQRKILEFQQTDERFQDLTRKYIVAKLASALPTSTITNPGADSEMGLLRREMARQRGHMAVRRLVQGLPMLLPKLKPCLLMSPLSVAQYLDASHATYDLVVFDEASQIPVWDAVGAIARGKQLVVVGDPKQLPPTSFFNKGNDDDADDGGGDDITDLESILDECMGAGLRTERLKWHYRSKHESLITFSNTNYYESQLITFPSPVTDDMAVRYQPVNGIYDRGIGSISGWSTRKLPAGICSE